MTDMRASATYRLETARSNLLTRYFLEEDQGGHQRVLEVRP